MGETMISFKGRLGFIQYMPKKPTKWGLKAFVLSDAHIYNWNLYMGKPKISSEIYVQCMCAYGMQYMDVFIHVYVHVYVCVHLHIPAYLV